MHIHMDTVKLDGKYFTARVKDGDAVKKGDLLVEFDREKIMEAGYDVITPVVVTNSGDYAGIRQEKSGAVEPGETVLVLEK